MTQITAAQVKELRERTGAGMMECKSALTEANGDFEEATKVLRKKGLAAAGKKAGRITSEGLVHAVTRGAAGVLVEVNCETDFVAKTEQFKEFVNSVSEIILSSHAADVDALMNEKWPGDPDNHTVKEVVSTRIATIGENISVRRFSLFDGGEGSSFGSYIHGNGKIGVLVELSGAAGNPEAEAAAREVAMHVAASEPRFVRREEVQEKDLETEKEVARDAALKSGKPEAVVEKIVAGKMEKFYAETVLLEQPYVRDDKVTISQMLAKQGKDAGAKLDVKRFSRFKVGEGIQKREDDFAAEVMAQVNR